MKIIVDSSVIIDFIRVGVGYLPDLQFAAKVGNVKLILPTVVVLELWSGKSMNFVKNKNRVDLIFSSMERINLTEAIAKRAGDLIRAGDIHSGFDSVIAASALELDAWLATGNRRHFSRVKGLKLFDSGEGVGSY